MLVVPAWNELMNPSTPGTNVPTATPAAIAAKIQKVSHRSRKESFFEIPLDIGLCLPGGCQERRGGRREPVISPR